jgi:hypothetical protein
MKIYLLIIPIALLMPACADSKKTSLPYSYELAPGTRDTINVIDHAKRKQGIWIERGSTDTLVYLNDTAYSVKGKSVDAVIDSLKKAGRNLKLWKSS